MKSIEGFLEKVERCIGRNLDESERRTIEWLNGRETEVKSNIIQLLESARESGMWSDNRLSQGVLKKIKVEPLSKNGETLEAYLIDDRHALFNGESLVQLFEVVPLNIEEGIYQPAQMANFIVVGYGSCSEEDLLKTVEELKRTTAYELLTEHFDIRNETFIVNGGWKSPPIID